VVPEWRIYYDEGFNVPQNYDYPDKQNEIDLLNQLLKTTRETDDREAEANVLFHTAFLVWRLGNFEGSLIQIEAAIDIIDSLRAQITSPESRAEYFANVRRYYESYIYLLSELHKQHPALGYDAKARQSDERMHKALADG